MTSTEKVIQKARELIDKTPEGKRYSQLHAEIAATYPDIPLNTIHGSLYKFRIEMPDAYYLPTRGLYRNVKYKTDGETVVQPGKVEKVTKIKEEEFYEPFADWIVNELEEATKAISLGGNKFKDKWGTPDIIAVREARRSDIIKPPTEIISAEIKLDIAGLITERAGKSSSPGDPRGLPGGSFSGTAATETRQHDQIPSTTRYQCDRRVVIACFAN